MVLVRTLKEVSDEAIANSRKLAEEIYIDGDYVVLDVDYKYEIELSSLNRPDLLLGFVLHLSDKTWMTPRRIARFIYIVAEHHGMEVNRP